MLINDPKYHYSKILNTRQTYLMKLICRVFKHLNTFSQVRSLIFIIRSCNIKLPVNKTINQLENNERLSYIYIICFSFKIITVLITVFLVESYHLKIFCHFG